MKLVLDTNIFVSAFYWGGNPKKIIDRIIDGTDELFISNEILDEIAATMAGPKFKTKPEIVEEYTRSINEMGKKVFITGKVRGICRDKDDDDKIECGILAGADYLITGDNDLLILGHYQQVKFITAKEYLSLFD